MGIADTPELLVADAPQWRAWLAQHAATSTGVFLVLARRHRPAPTSLTHADALDEALCFGWIDGLARRRDEDTTTLRFTPRTARSPWSARNVEHVARLEREGRMSGRGRAEVERARADGRYAAAYAGPADMPVPADFAAAIAAEPHAQAMFAVLTSQNRYALLHRLGQLKTVAARERRIARYVEMLARGETVYPQTAGHPGP